MALFRNAYHVPRWHFSLPDGQTEQAIRLESGCWPEITFSVRHGMISRRDCRPPPLAPSAPLTLRTKDSPGMNLFSLDGRGNGSVRGGLSDRP